MVSNGLTVTTDNIQHSTVTIRRIVMSSNRTEGAVLIGRKDQEYWFIDSVFLHDADFFGCTGCTVYPVSEEYAKDAMSPGSLADRLYDCWAERAANEWIKEDCANCRSGPDEDGCEHCGYESLSDFCVRIAQSNGYETMFDFPGHAYQEALEEKLGPLEFADTSGCGRIFGRDDWDDFDEVYNRKAIVACQAYEAGAVDYDYTCRVIFGD
jgi:hypothetical protein